MKKTIINNESRNIKIGVILSLLSFVISMVVNVVFISFINRDGVAGKSQYGLYTFSTSMTSLLLALSFGMNSSYIRFATIAKKENGDDGLRKINGSFALLFIIASVVAVILGTIIIIFFHQGLIGTNYDASKREIIVSCLIISVINVAVSLLANIFTLYTNYNMRFIWARMLTITTSILTPLVTSIIIYFNHNIVTYVCVELAINLLSLVINLIYCVKSLKYKIKITLKKEDFHVLLNILKFSFFIFLVTVVTELTSSTPKILLGLFPNASGDSEITVAYYQLSATFIGAIAVASSAVSATYVPLVNRYVAYGSNDDINRIFIKSTKVMIVAYAFVMGGFIACGRLFVVLWQGKNYDNTNLIYYLACVLSIISFVPSTFGITSEIQRAKNKHHFRSFVLLIGFGVNFLVSLLILVFLPRFVNVNDPNYFVYQVVACAIGFGVGNAVNAVVMSIYNKKTIKLSMGSYYKILLFYLVLVFLSVATSYFTSKIIPLKLNIIVEMILQGLVFVIIFSLLVFLFDRNFLRSLFAREETEVSKQIAINPNCENLDKSRKVLVFTDFDRIINSVKNNGNRCKSLFNCCDFALLKESHERFGFNFVITINNNINLKEIPTSFLEDLRSSSDWLSVSFASGHHAPYMFLDAPYITKDFGDFVRFFSKNKVRIERVIIPDFEITDTKLGYFKNFYDFKISGFVVHNTGLKSSLVNNLIRFSFGEIDSINSVFTEVNHENIGDLESWSNKNISTVDDVLKDVFVNRKYPSFYNKKIAVINTYNSLSTGTLAKSIMSAASDVGVETRLFYGRLKDEKDAESYFFGANRLINFLNNVYVKFSGNIGHAHYFETKRLIKKLNEFRPDIIHLHNIAGNCLNYKLLFNYLIDKRVIVTMHDCFWLTGRCSHFTYSGVMCEEWQKGCQKCRHLNFYMQSYLFDKANKLFEEKRNFINSCNRLHLVCISEWQKSLFNLTNIDKRKVHLIHNGIKPTTYKRNENNSNLKSLIFVSSYLTKDKGIDEINKIADSLDRKKYLVKVVGKLPKNTQISANIQYLGTLSNNKVMEEIANSDLFIYPTHADTLPTVLIESLMVGTPVISFDIGGCKDVVGEYGKLIKYGDINSFIYEITHFNFNSFERDEISEKTLKKFDVDVMKNNYMSLYAEVLRNE